MWVKATWIKTSINSKDFTHNWRFNVKINKKGRPRTTFSGRNTVPNVSTADRNQPRICLLGIYTRQKRNAPLRYSHSDLLKYENVNCHEILISDQILLKLECDVDEYSGFPCVGPKHIKANGKRFFEALIQRYCLHGIPSMFYICKVWKRYIVVMWDNHCVHWCFFVIQKSIFII